MSDTIKASDLARKLGISKDAVLKRIKRDQKYPGAFKDDSNQWRVPVDEIEELRESSTPSMDMDEAGTPVDEPASMGSGTPIDGSTPMDEPTSIDEDGGGLPSTPPTSIDESPTSMDEAVRSMDDPTAVHVDQVPEPMTRDVESMDRVDDVQGGHAAVSMDRGVDRTGRFAQMVIDHEIEILRVKLASAETQGDSLRRETDTLREALDDARGEVSHLRTVNERLSMAVTNEQVLRLGSAPSPEAIATATTDLDQAIDELDTPQEDKRPSVTIRGAKQRGWFARMFGSK